MKTYGEPVRGSVSR